MAIYAIGDVQGIHGADDHHLTPEPGGTQRRRQSFHAVVLEKHRPGLGFEDGLDRLDGTIDPGAITARGDQSQLRRHKSRIPKAVTAAKRPAATWSGR